MNIQLLNFILKNVIHSPKHSSFQQKANENLRGNASHPSQSWAYIHASRHTHCCRFFSYHSGLVKYIALKEKKRVQPRTLVGGWGAS